jgi:hypothetical protein
MYQKMGLDQTSADNLILDFPSSRIIRGENSKMAARGRKQKVTLL